MPFTHLEERNMGRSDTRNYCSIETISRLRQEPKGRYIRNTNSKCACSGHEHGTGNTHSCHISSRIMKISMLPGMHSLLLVLCFSFVLKLTSAGTLRENHGRAVDYLRRFGYIGGPLSESQNLMSHESMMQSIKALQKMGNIPQTGQIDAQTMQLMQKPRCGVPDENAINNNNNSRRKRYVTANSVWPNKHLTFRIMSYTTDLPEKLTRQAIYEGFKVWSDYTDLTFTETLSGNADIIIKFAAGYHKDGYPFDGPGLILAHAFYPGEDKGGDTHFDEDEHWVYNSSEKGVDLFMVAAHEFGHALGLAHSNEPGALMYPWYQGYQENYKLPYDDIIGIQYLYGGKSSDKFPPKSGKTPRIPVVTERPPERPPDRPIPPRDDGSRSNDNPSEIDPCNHKFDAIAVLRGEIFLFINEYYWRQDSRGLLSVDKSSIHSFWYGLPPSTTHVDAVFERPSDHKFIFFIGQKYWVFDTNRLGTNFPKEGKPLTDFGIQGDIKKIDAAFVWSYNNRTYLMSGDMYWKLNVESTQVEYDYPRDMHIWKGVPDSVDTAFRHISGKTYFFKNDSFYEFNDRIMQVKKGYPKKISEHFWGCAQRRALGAQRSNNVHAQLYGVRNEDDFDSNGCSDTKFSLHSSLLYLFVSLTMIIGINKPG